MSDIAIRVDNLSKRYYIGQTQERHDTLRDALVAGLRGLSSVVGGGRRVDNGPQSADETEFWALKDISFEVKQGEVVGIIGRNGAGKSTLLKVLSRITEPTSGRVELHGRVASLLEVGTGFHPELTGRENIYLNGAILGMKRAEIDRQFDEIVAFAEIEKFLDTPVKRYSSGMYVRLAFAVAAHLEPEILLVDEVLAVGDAAFQKKCLGKMSDVAKEGRTVLFVSHNLGAVTGLCPQVMLIENGSVDIFGPSTLIAEHYLSRRLESLAKDVSDFIIDEDASNSTPPGRVTFNKLRVQNPRNTEIGPRTGDPLQISIEYSATCKYISPAFVVSINDMYGQELIRLSTMPISGYVIENVFPKGEVELLLESLPLVAGRYSLDVGFVRERMEWILKLENVIGFTVAPQDTYGSGLMLDRSRGLLVVDHKWDHRIRNTVNDA